MDYEAAYREAEETIGVLQRDIRALESRLHEVEAALQQSRSALELTSSLIEHSPDPMMVLDRAFIFTTVNTAYASLHNTTREAVIGQQAPAFLGDAVFEQMIHPMLERAFAGETVQYEKWFTFPELGRRYLEVRYFPLSPGGVIAHVAIALRDITDRRTAEEQLRESEDRFRAFSEATTEGIIIHAQGKILDFNQAIVDHFGYTPEELRQMTVLDLTAPVSRPTILQHMIAKDFGPYEAVSLHKDGTSTIGEIRARNVQYRGRTVRVVAIRDVTGLRHAQDQLHSLLRNTEEWAAEMDATIRSIPDGYIVYNPDGSVRRMNETAKQLFDQAGVDHLADYHQQFAELPLETLDGQPFPFERSPVFRAFHGETVRGEVVVFRLPERTSWFSISASPICIEEHMLGVVVEFTDITTLHQLQEQRDLYTHTISHDLRSPLTTIHGYAQVLYDAIEAVHVNGTLRESANAILRSARRMNVMIQDLVDLARLEGGQMVLNQRAIPLASYLCDLLKRSAAVIDVGRIQAEVPEALPPVCADEDRLERIIINLLSNALKYSDPATPVRIRARVEDGMVAVSIADRGYGIAPEDLPHLFERYYRAKGMRKTEGIGLGLYITRMLVEAHGGRIEVESRVGEGSTFTFTLPRA